MEKISQKPRSAIKSKTSEKIVGIINTVFLILIAIATLYPFLYILAVAFTESNDIINGGIWILPRNFTLENFAKAFQDDNIVSGFTVTILRTLIGTILSVVLTAMLAFALTDKKLIGRRFFIKFVFFTTLFNGGMIPFAALLRDLKLMNSFMVYIMPAIYSFTNMIIMRASFEAIPESLVESAKIDGASTLTIFVRMVLPLSLPVLATVGLFTAVFHWNDWFAGQFYVTTKSLKPAATLLQEIITQSMGNLSGNAANGPGGGTVETTPQSLQMAFIVITVFPIVCVYPFLQKHFVKGAMVGSIKE